MARATPMASSSSGPSTQSAMRTVVPVTSARVASTGSAGRRAWCRVRRTPLGVGRAVSAAAGADSVMPMR